MKLAAAILYAFLYLPLGVVIALSLNEAGYGGEWRGFSLGGYKSALANPAILAAVKNTLLLAGISTPLAVLLGSLLGYGLARHRFRGKTFVSRVLIFSIAVPDIIMAVALLLFYALVRRWIPVLELGLPAMVMAHVTFQIPFVAMVIRARLRGLDPALDEAAHDLGASRWQRFWHVTLPLMRPGIAAGALIAFTLSLDDFVVSFFTSGPGTSTIPIYIYGAVKRGITAEIHAISSLLIFAALIAAAGMAVPRGGPRR